MFTDVVDMEQVVDESFCQYAGAVLQSRALIDVRDCIKPSTRQMLFALYDANFLSNEAYRKTLKAIGAATNIYIHGDSSLLGIIMRSAQKFAMRYPLIDVHGNAGTLHKTGNWAAARYTESRLSEIADKIIMADLKKDTIAEWRDNYDDTIKYPAVLPSKGFYNIVNGSLGIAVGAGSMIPQFNLKDVNKALETLLLNPDATFEELYCQPDFATGAYLINERQVKNALKYGNKEQAIKNGVDANDVASCKLRSNIDYDKKDNCLIVTELPYGVYTETVCEQLETILEDETNPGIDRFNDLTGATPFIKIYLMKNIDPERVKRYLFKNTSLQYYSGINLTMLDNNGRFPKVFTWKEALQAHINHEVEVYRRGYEYDAKILKHKIHILEGLIICLASIDEVVTLIKNSESSADAKKKLIERFNVDEEQASAVLKITLSRLARLEVEKIKSDKIALEAQLAEIEKILNDKELFNNELIKTWRAVADKFGDEHRTKIIEVDETAIDDKEIEEVPPEDVVVVTTTGGFIKRVPLSTFKVQKRGGVGIKSIDDVIMDTCKTNTIDVMMFFTDKGRMYRLLVNDIPSGTNASKGVNIGNLIALDANEKIISVSSLKRKSLPKYIIFVTRKGLVKKSLLSAYTTTKRSGGVKALKLTEGDEVAKVLFQDDEEIILVTKNGNVLRFESSKVAPIGKDCTGVKGINLRGDDYIVTALSLHKYSDDLFIAHANGLGKKVNTDELPIQSRGGVGVTVGKDEVAGAAMISNVDNIIITGTANSICISAKDIPLQGRATQGAALIKGNVIKSIAKI